MGSLKRLVTLVLLGVAGSSAPAQTTYFREMFDTNGPLVGLTPNVGLAWQQTGANPASPLTVVSNALSINPQGQDAYGRFAQGIPITAGTRFYTGVDINVSAATAQGFYFLHTTRTAGAGTLFDQRIHIRSEGAGFQVGIASNSEVITPSYGATLNFNQSYRVVVSWEFVAGAQNDVMNLYLDPTNATEAANTPYVANHVWATGIGEPSGFLPAVNIMQGAAGMSPTLSIDRLVVTNDFSVVSFIPVPEPTVVWGLSFGGICLLARFRKRFVPA